MNDDVTKSVRRRLVLLLAIAVTLLTLIFPATVSAQAAPATAATPAGALPVAPAGVPVGATAPLFWYLLAAAIAFMVPIGLVLIGVTGLDAERAWNAALGAMGAIALAGLAYWAIGFALQFGGIGLAYLRPELRNLVWEWSPLPFEWGVGWGAAGLSGWFLSGGEMSAIGYALFLAHLPWVFTAALLPVLALRGRAPATATLLLALLFGGLVYPLAGNWVQGGGWLSALGRNLTLGHGFVDAGGAGTVFLLAASFSLAALAVWSPRRTGAQDRPGDAIHNPAAYQPLLTVIGSLFVLGGLLGWLWANPLQVETLSDMALLRGSVNVALAAVGGAIVPLLYSWFVAGRSNPTLTARGLSAGAIAGLAVAPFVPSGPALLIGFLAGATTPFVSYLVDHLLHLDDATGIVVTAGIPSMIGLLLLGIFADGAAGAGWQLTGVGSYLGVAGQGVTGLLAAAGFQRSFPSQMQAQLLGVVTIGLWGLITGLIICAPLGLLFHSLQHSAQQTPVAPSQPAAPAHAKPPITPTIEPELAAPEAGGQSTRLFR